MPQHRILRFALVSVPVPRYPLAKAEQQFSHAFFQKYARTYLSSLESDDLKHLWQIEMVNQGLLYIASSLRLHGYEVSYHAIGNNPYNVVAEGVSELLAELAAEIERIDVVCMYAITCNIHVATELGSILKTIKPNLIVGLGGPHTTGLAYQAADHFFRPNTENTRAPVFDFVGIGEGEQALVELADAMATGRPLSNVKGILCGNETMILRNGFRKRLDPVDLPIPAYDLSRLTKLPAARIFPNRGCSNCCTFCADPWRRKVTYVTTERTAEEINYLSDKYGTKYLYIGCEDFFHDEARAKALARLIHRVNPGLTWTAQCRVKPSPSAEVFEVMAESGCVGIEFGVESANQHILDHARKNIRLHDARQNFVMAKKFGLYTHAYWMIGLPGETWETAQQTQRTMLEWGEEGVTDTWEYKAYIPYPGTVIFDKPTEFGVRIRTYDFSQYHYALTPVIETADLSYAAIQEILHAGLEASARVFTTSNIGADRNLEVGVDLETIECMF
jgi:anaerobic magnesium-protoporphyrin IX monomethyl ester cyclase